MTLIKKMLFDGVDNMDLFSMLTDQRNLDIPSYKVLGKKVSEDCSVSIKYMIFISFFYYTIYFLECVLVSK